MPRFYDEYGNEFYGEYPEPPQPSPPTQPSAFSLLGQLFSAPFAIFFPQGLSGGQQSHSYIERPTRRLGGKEPYRYNPNCHCPACMGRNQR